jgi:hypothetical protein
VVAARLDVNAALPATVDRQQDRRRLEVAAHLGEQVLLESI